MTIIDLKQDTKEWLEYRKSHFNASECGDLFGVGFNDELKLAHIKYGDYKPFFNEAMRRGKEAEPEIREKANVILNKNFEPLVAVWDKNNKFSASFDGYDKNTGEILEIKYSLDEYLHICKYGEPSKKYYLQVQHQLLVSDAKKAYFAVSEPFGDIKIIEVAPDRATQNEIIKKWLEFYEKYGALNAQTLPPLEKVIDDASQFACEAKMTINRIVELKAQIKELDNELKENEKVLISYAGGVKTKFWDKATYYPSVRTSYDYKGFLADNGLEITDKYAKTATYWTLKVK